MYNTIAICGASRRRACWCSETAGSTWLSSSSSLLCTSVMEREITVPNTCHLGNTTQLYAGLHSYMQQHTTQCGLVQANTAIYGLLQVYPAWCKMARAMQDNARWSEIAQNSAGYHLWLHIKYLPPLATSQKIMYSRPIVEFRTKSPSDILLFTLVHATIFYSILDYPCVRLPATCGFSRTCVG
jgi:hypothetical protein